ncbi:LysE family translocator [Achromobacter xylosoxidans]|uniref:LysE family translocator n=1 Tax=Alcaligenes xylosoxydans xylosoxydans TaxID=85698 RepID=A0A424WIS8_ALCXX|nr:LysE family transporter [Achromobacter xylosoxidans]MBC9903777.1 LysE family transporter [Achromobacter xylosoxidans]MBD0866961.1 LysE family transporter [Achromobacter xylosoxidans]QNP84687.1 LysE family transporter [Achromobacter xylosoxidans]RPJ93191.1 LysE family translocator [Achromobacter xylosoxidans]
MLSLATAGVFAVGVTVILAMPGPTNTLLAAAGLRLGFTRAARLTMAELAGYVVSISLWGRFLEQAAKSLPWLPACVRAASSIYIACLAVRMWRAARAVPTVARQVIGMRTLFTATLLNPKGILFASAVFPPAAFWSLPAYLAAMALFTALLVPIGLAWVAFGASLGGAKTRWIDPARAQRGASVILGLFSLTLAWTAFR